MEPIWILYGSYMDPIWIPIWILCGSGLGDTVHKGSVGNPAARGSVQGTSRLRVGLSCGGPSRGIISEPLQTRVLTVFY